MVYISLDHRKSSSVFGDTNFLDLEVTHRGMHRFIPRHQDEIVIEIGDPIHVFRLDDDLWCEGQPVLHTCCICISSPFLVVFIKEQYE